MLEHPDAHRVGILIEKPVATGILDMWVPVFFAYKNKQVVVASWRPGHVGLSLLSGRETFKGISACSNP